MKRLTLAFTLLALTVSACEGDNHSRNRKYQRIDSGTESDVDAEIAPLPDDIGATDLDVVSCDCIDSDRAVACECFEFQIADAYDLDPFGDSP